MYNIRNPLKQCDIRREMRFQFTGAEKRRNLALHFQNSDREFICNNTVSQFDGATNRAFSSIKRCMRHGDP
jgi:hypothetical protein